MTKYILGLCIFLYVTSFTQGLAIEQWRDHLPYSNGISVAASPTKIYCATSPGLFSYDLEDNSISHLSKVEGLSDINVSYLAYSYEYEVLVIAYKNANIDLLTRTGIINISDIKRKNLVNKTINHIKIVDDKAYLSCGFGIVVLDLERREIKDTYKIGEEGANVYVNGIEFDSLRIYAATNEGIISASRFSNNLSYFAEWSKDTKIPDYEENFTNIKLFDSVLYVLRDKDEYKQDLIYFKKDSTWNLFDTVANEYMAISASDEYLFISTDYGMKMYNDSLIVKHTLYRYNDDIPFPRPGQVVQEGDKLWIADRFSGLAYKRPRKFEFNIITPSGPDFYDSFGMDCMQGQLWVAAGSRSSSWSNNWSKSGAYSFINEGWKSYNLNTDTNFQEIRDITEIAINPNDPSHVFMGSWYNGLIEMKNGQFLTLFDKTNSTITNNEFNESQTGIGGLAFDNNGNLWVTNSNTSSPLSVFNIAERKWTSFSIPGINSSQLFGDIVVTDWGQKWIVLPRLNGILVYDDAGTIDDDTDDQSKVLTSVKGNGGLPVNSVTCLAEDHDGEIWVGTTEGIAVFYSPELVFSGENFDAQQVLIELDGHVQHLLETESITAIVVDGDNRKWISTENGGVFMMSEDGTEQIYHFTEDNSPLFSNTVVTMEIDGQTGEVFFGTEKGILSFKSTATDGEVFHTDVLVYPNPVRPGYEGKIAVRGLVNQASVKITDISGNLIYETTAKGGQAVWDGKNFSGERAHTGVYLVFSTNSDGTEKLATKIMFIN